MLKLIKITPLSPFTTEIRPNTIFGALCWNIFKYKGKNILKEFLEDFKKAPFFVLSSPIFYKKECIFLPRPILKGSPLEDFNIETIKYIYPVLKLLKEISYLPWFIYKEILKNKIKTEKELFKEIIKTFCEKNNINFTGNLEEILINIMKRNYKNFKNFIEEFFPNNIYSKKLFVKTSINRLTKNALEGNLINEIAYFYKPFYILIYIFDKKKWEEYKIEEYLKKIRLGGRKSIGLGKVKVEFINNTENFLDEMQVYIENFTNRFITLSPFIYKNNQNIDVENSYYNIEFFQGAREDNLININFIISSLPIWKEMKVFLKEGSIISLKKFNKKDKKNLIIGDLEESLSKNNVTIYNYAYAFPLFIQN